MPNEINLGLAVTFIPNKRQPIHNWFYYKEGFSHELVKWLIDKYQIKGKVWDPFAGSGTTLLACKEKGLQAIGCEVSPLASLVSKVKTRNYDLEKVKDEFEKLKALNPYLDKAVYTKEKWMKKYFYGESLDLIFHYRKYIDRIEDEKTRDLFFLALISVVDKVMLAEKRGGSLRLVKKPRLPVKVFLLKKIKYMIKDLEKSRVDNENFVFVHTKWNFARKGMKGPYEPEVVQADARAFRPEANSIDAVITSPPYLNKIEYTTVYKVELGLFFGEPAPRLRAFIGEKKFRLEEHEGEQQLPLIAQAYFEDLKKVLENIYAALKPEGTAFIDIAGGCFPNQLIESDEKIEEMAEEMGFAVKERIVCREIACHKQRGIKTGKVRESIVVLQKPAPAMGRPAE